MLLTETETGGSCSYVTHHYDNARTGWNPFEDTLTVGNVSNIRQLFSHQVDGDDYAQPLFVQGVNIPGKGKHNVVCIATEGDSVYAFDADTKVPMDSTGTDTIRPLWARITGSNTTLIPPEEVPIDNSDIPWHNIDTGNRSDLSNNVMYVVAKSKIRNTIIPPLSLALIDSEDVKLVGEPR
jgi:hypothetical protein